jgi:hypothetical protein
LKGLDDLVDVVVGRAVLFRQLLTRQRRRRAAGQIREFVFAAELREISIVV